MIITTNANELVAIMAPAISMRWLGEEPDPPDLTDVQVPRQICKVFEPGLFEPKSPLPGNRIFGAETKRPKRLERFRDAVAETKSR